jgi:pimeloyl-ACP methyl ester carboxylesterase
MLPMLVPWMLGMLCYDATGVLGSIGVPTLVVAGDRDPLILPEASRQIATAVPGARLVTLVPARHQGFFERHEEFGREVTSFVEKAIPAATPV